MSDSKYKQPDLRLLGDEHVRLYRETDGETGYLWNGAPILLVTTKGRLSGEPRAIAIIYTQVGDSASQLVGGGRYDDLIRVLGAGQDTPAIGFAYGLERIMQELYRLHPPIPTVAWMCQSSAASRTHAGGSSSRRTSSARRYSQSSMLAFRAQKLTLGTR